MSVADRFDTGFVWQVVTWCFPPVSIMNRQPSFWYEQWGSNHFEWQTDLKKEFRIDISTIFTCVKAAGSWNGDAYIFNCRFNDILCQN